MSIPRTLILFWHRKSEMPEQISAAIQGTLKRNADYQVIFADDEYVREHIATRYAPDILTLYDSNRIPASRSDLARLLLLHAFGGIYIDAAMELLQPIDSIMTRDVDLIVVRRDDFPKYADCPEKAHVTNAMLAAAPGNQMIDEARATVISNLRGGQHNHNVWRATGPYCLNLLLPKYAHLYRIQELSFSALLDSFFAYRRVAGVSNAWMEQQKSGIFSE